MYIRILIVRCHLVKTNFGILTTAYIFLSMLFHFVIKALLILANVLLGVGTMHGCVGMFPEKEGGIQVFKSTSSTQTVGAYF
jgi:hypothetical protein